MLYKFITDVDLYYASYLHFLDILRDLPRNLTFYMPIFFTIAGSNLSRIFCSSRALSNVLFSRPFGTVVFTSIVIWLCLGYGGATCFFGRFGWFFSSFFVDVFLFGP